MNIIEAINDPHLFRPLFKDLGTWRAWQVFLKSLFALPLDEQELALYTLCTGRETPPTTPFAECWCPTGRRSGKSFIAALTAVFLACFKSYQEYLSPGERAVVGVIAADRAQAQIIFRYIRGFLNSNKMLKKMIESERSDSIDLNNSVSIEVKTCSYRSSRGPSYAAIIADEIAFWRDDTSSNPADEVLRAVRPGMATIPNSLLLCISSPYARTGPLWQAMNKHHGRDDSDVLVWNSDSRTMNPTIKQSIIDRDMTLDPEAARSEWLAQFRSDLETFLDLAILESCVVQGRHELPPRLASNLNFNYTAFVDPSGGRNDAATLAIAHREGDKAILDLARRWPSPHDPAQVTREMASIIKGYGIFRVTGDRYAGAWPQQEFLRHNVFYEPSTRDKSALYIDFLPMINSGLVELLDLPILKNELASLERRTRSAGRDLIDHPPRGQDDLANAVAGAVTLAGGPGREATMISRPLGERPRSLSLSRHLFGLKVAHRPIEEPQGVRWEGQMFERRDEE
jgi:hypothetical protein